MGCVNLNLSSSLVVDADALNNLKTKVICEYQDLLKLIQKGYKLDYEFILEEISLIGLLENSELDTNLSLFISQFYTNNKWETMLS